MGIGSNKHNLVGEPLIILWISFTGSKALKAGGAKVNASVADSEVGNMSLILPIFHRKKSKLICKAFS